MADEPNGQSNDIDVTTASLEVYKLAVQEIGRFETNRQTSSNVLRSIATLILGAEAYVATLSDLRSFTSLVLTLLVAYFGLSFVAVWSRLAARSDREVFFMHQYVRNLELRPELKAVGADLYTSIYGWFENKKPYTDIYPERPIQYRLLYPRFFGVAMAAIPVLLIIGMFLIRQPFFAELVTPLTAPATPVPNLGPGGGA